MSKEAFCLVLDLRLERADLEQAVKAFLFPRLLSPKKTDWFTVVLLGTDLTDHHLDVDEFPHLTSLHHDGCASFEQFRRIRELPRSTQSNIGDLVDGVIVGADLLIEHTKGKVFDRQIVLITEDGENVKWKDEEDLEGVAETLREHDMSLNIYSNKTFELLHCQSQPLDQLRPTPRSVRRVAQFKGDLWIGSQFSIPVQMHAVCQPGKLPAPSRSWQGKPLEMSYTGGNPEERVKAYRYGKDWIPFSKLDEEQLALPVSKGIFVLGFSPGPLPLEWWMGPASLLTGQDEPAQSLITGLSQCLQQREQVTIARLVRQEGAAPRLVVLMPHAAGLLVIGMPWSEDVRAFAFPSLERGLTALLPTDTQMDVMRRFVQQVQQTTATVPTDNPAYVSLLERIAARCLDPRAPVTPSTALQPPAHQTNPIAEAFPIRPAARWSYAPVQSRQWETTTAPALAEKDAADPLPPSPTRRQIRPDHAIEDFNAMCTNRHHDLVKPAMLQMMTLIADISHAQPTQAIEYLRQLRIVAQREGEESLYNRFMTDLNELRLSGSDQFPAELWNLLDPDLKEL